MKAACIPCGTLRRATKLALAVTFTLLLWPRLPAAQSQADPESGEQRRAKSVLSAPHAMAVTANPHATRAALAILREGGNAVDAAAAAQFVLNVVEPQSSGIGGGAFLLIYLAKTKQVVAIDGREEAPAAASAGMFLEPDGRPQQFYPRRITGGNAVGVPGLVMALEKALRRYGEFSLARALAPAIALAEEGFAVSPRLARSLERHRERLAKFPATRAVFFAGREPLKAGAWLKQPELAATLRLLAAQGSAAFYRGSLARDIVRAVRKAPINPGRLVLADLEGYDAPLRQPVRSGYRGYTLYGMGPPSSGGVTLFQILQLLEYAPPAGEGPQSAQGIHRFAQAARLAYADRARYLADPDFVQVPVAGLLDTAYARRRAAAHPWKGRLARVEAGSPEGAPSAAGLGAAREHQSTTHLSVVDEARNMVALTSSVEQAFGSGIIVPGRGFLLNNQLTDFSARVADRRGRLIANRVQGGRLPRRTALENPTAAGGKRPRSSMAPTFVFKQGRPLLVLGSPGGPRIIQYVARTLLLVLDKGWDVQAAIAAPHATHLGNRTVLEPSLRAKVLAAELRKLGHDVAFRDQNSGLHAIMIDPISGLLHAGVDPRREGTAAGY
ncbi:MAG: gamma-glutamyltransferase [SAR324 cluster bacterium]|nr:gamma-glutamyltransferase [SAR324 cluster bacterium]